jgi:hypothetical protein
VLNGAPSALSFAGYTVRSAANVSFVTRDVSISTDNTYASNAASSAAPVRFCPRTDLAKRDPSLSWFG